MPPYAVYSANEWYQGQAAYTISVDRQSGIIEVTLSGMMSIGEIAHYIAELTRQFVANRLRAYTTVIDVSACPFSIPASPRR